MQRRLLFLSLAICAVLASVAMPANAQTDLDWRTFKDQFGTSVSYPSAIFSSTADSAENGVMLTRPDRLASLRIFSLANEQRETPRMFLQRKFPFDRGALSYDRVTPRFFAVSARRDGHVAYTRCNFAQRVHCVELTYPVGEKRAFDSITTRVSLTLRPSGD